MKRLLLLAGSTHFPHLTLILEEMERCNIEPDEEFRNILTNKLSAGKAKLVEQVGFFGLD